MTRLESAFCFDLSRVFLQGATTHPLHHRKVAWTWLQDLLAMNVCGWDSTMELARGHYASTYLGYFFRVPPCHPYTIFSGIVVIVGRALCFCFDLVKVFLQGPPYHPYTKFFFRNCHYCEKAALCLYFDLAKAFLQDATTPTLHPFFRNCHYCVKGQYGSAST